MAAEYLELLVPWGTALGAKGLCVCVCVCVYVCVCMCMCVCMCVCLFFAHMPFHASKVYASQRLKVRRFREESSWPLENGEKKVEIKSRNKMFQQPAVKDGSGLGFSIRLSNHSQQLGH